MRNDILHSTQQAVEAAKTLTDSIAINFIETVSKAITTCLQQKGKLLIAGNGGSLCDAMHFAEELTGYYRKKRAALPAIALADPGHLTCVGNDSSFNHIFARHIEALGKSGDIFIALTTSGNSQNLIQAIETAKQLGLITVGFLGKTGGKIAGLCDYEWIVKGFETSDRIQEAHMAAIHIIIEMVENQLFSSINIADQYATTASLQ